jgi:hypothetical protein
MIHGLECRATRQSQLHRNIAQQLGGGAHQTPVAANTFYEASRYTKSPWMLCVSLFEPDSFVWGAAVDCTFPKRSSSGAGIPSHDDSGDAT